jgi:hypothetical protein
MGFLAPKPQVQAAPPPPVVEDTQATQQQYQDMLRKRKGRAASVLNEGGDQGTAGANAPQTASKQLLGS